ncbi:MULTISPECIES: flagellar protein FlaG [Alkalimonas]|uniref:Flagellar protein FlaG n=2 Tax=Alkalimonas TaxID=265980 RepID=A0ABU7J3W8_9GAMM|nr:MULTISPECIES: flagellar protein FlaG [unclassified Alkalimonas]MEE2001193.1 flagellar protein FlaG [Alkalimonas sp. MEB108]MEE2025826.1 flagellar protein FlaG [Alkalimonas sp. MEB004]
MSSMILNSSSVTSSILPVEGAEVRSKAENESKQNERLAPLEPVKATKPESVSRKELDEAVEVMNNAVAIQERSLSFSIDDASGREVIKVVDFKTSELIRQIPSEELLKVAQDVKRLQQEMGRSIGLLVDSKV